MAWKARLLWFTWPIDPSYFAGIYLTDTTTSRTGSSALKREAHERLEALCQSQLGTQVPYETVVVTGRPVVRNPALWSGSIPSIASCWCLCSTDKPEHQLSLAARQNVLLLHTASPHLYGAAAPGIRIYFPRLIEVGDLLSVRYRSHPFWSTRARGKLALCQSRHQ